MTTWIRLRLAFFATICTVAYVIGGILGPTIAFACEGAGEEKPRLVNKEGKELVKNDFTGTSGPTAVDTAKGTEITCMKDTVKGTETEEAKGTMTVSLKECTNPTNAKCTGGTGAANGELIIPTTWALKRKQGGGLLLNETITGTFNLKCGMVPSEMKGSFLIIVTVKKLGTVQEFEITQKEGTQEPDEYENESKEKLKSILELSIEEAKFEQAGIEGNEEITFEEEAEFLE